MDGVAGILVVDDEESMRNLLCRTLRRAGHENVDLAADGQEALEKLAGSDFALVILDVVMPRLGGIETLMEIRRTHPSLEVIVVSGRVQVDASPFEILTENLGVRRVFQKPVDLQVLMEEVGAAIDGS
jgi:DNA-binding response OmpR family regulator